MILKSYDIAARIPMTTAARNAGASGRTHWWAHVATVSAANKHAACIKARKKELVPAHADKLRAFSR
jgi:hypothetical protein